MIDYIQALKSLKNIELKSLLKSPHTVNFKIGDVLEGSVIRVINDDGYIIKLNENYLFTRSPVSLNEGERFQVSVEKFYPGVVLKLLGRGDEGVVESLLRSTIPYKRPMGELFEGLQDWIKKYSDVFIKEGGRPDNEILDHLQKLLRGLTFDNEKVNLPHSLKEFIESSGLLHERNLAEILISDKLAPAYLRMLREDLKATLLYLLERIEPKMSGEVEDSVMKVLDMLKRGAESTLKNIELMQALNYLSNKFDDYVHIQIPFSHPQGRETARLYFYKKKQEKKKGDVFEIVFFLELSLLGKITIVARFFKLSADVKFVVSEKRVSSYINENLGKLRKGLEGLGYSINTTVELELDGASPQAPYRRPYEGEKGEEQEFSDVLPEEIRIVDLKV